MSIVDSELRLAWSFPKDKGVRTKPPEKLRRNTRKDHSIEVYSAPENNISRRRHPSDRRWDLPESTRLRHRRY